MVRHESKRQAIQKILFAQVSKGDLVTIRDHMGEHKGHGTRRGYGDWVLVLESNGGTALTTRENTVALSKLKKLTPAHGVGQRLVYDDPRRFKS